MSFIYLYTLTDPDGTDEADTGYEGKWISYGDTYVAIIMPCNICSLKYLTSSKHVCIHSSKSP